MSKDHAAKLRADLNSERVKPFGLGCAYLFGGRQKDESIRLVHTALDAGIRYFDTARMYAEGQSETTLGEALRGRRSEVYITSKCGIWPANVSLAGKLKDKALAAARGTAPSLKSVVPAPTPRKPRFGMFASNEIVASVETSLSALKTDYIDFVLLHESRADHFQDPSVLEALRSLQKTGKIGGFGSATQPDVTLQIDRTGPHDAVMLQFKNDLLDATAEALKGSMRTRIVHSIFGSAFQDFVQLIQRLGVAHPDVQSVELDTENTRAWGGALLAYAARQTGEGLALFSTGQPDQIATTIECAEAMKGERLEALTALIAKYRSDRSESA